MPYARQPGLAALTALSEATLRTEAENAITEANRLRGNSIRAGEVLPFRKAERSTVLVARVGGNSHGILDHVRSGFGKPFVIDADTAPTGDTALHMFRQLQFSQNMQQVVAVEPCPTWTGATAAPPLVSLRSVSVTAVVRASWAQRHSGVGEYADRNDATPGVEQYENPAAIADDMIMRVWSIRRGDIEKHRFDAAASSPVSVMTASSKANLSLLGELSALDVETPESAMAGAITMPGDAVNPGPTVTNIAVQGVPSDLTQALLFASDLWDFEVSGYMNAAHFGTPPALEPDHVVVVSLTGKDRLLWAGETAFNPAKRNTIFPVGGYRYMVTFEAEFAR